jgi:hypothetical protein
MADVKNQVKSGIDAAADRGKNLTEKAADAVGSVAGPAREKVAEWAGAAGDAARQAGQKVQDWASDAYDTTAEQVGDFGKELTSLIRNHPLPALLVGFGIGMLIGRTARMV